MKLVILDSYDQASEWAAKYVRNSILKFQPSAEKHFVLGLPTGIEMATIFSLGNAYYWKCNTRAAAILFIAAFNCTIFR